MDSNFRYLLDLYGVETSYIDIWGGVHHANDHALKAILRAMGVKADTWEDCENSIREYQIRQAKRSIAPTLIYFEEHDHLEAMMTIPAEDEWETLQWKIVLEDGTEQSGIFKREHLPISEHFQVWDEAWQRFELYFPVSLPLGYHELRITGWNSQPEGGSYSRIIVVPRICYLTDGLQQGERYWGVNAQLYAATSTYNWGIGDFSDLKKLVDVTADLGGSIVGANPLHALHVGDIRGQSPYFPCSRAALHALYIDVGVVEEYQSSKKAQEFVATKEFQAKLKEQQKSDYIDYAAVMKLKMSALEYLYEEFRTAHLEKDTARAKQFRAFVEDRDDIVTYALFEALQEFCGKGTEEAWGWHSWPEKYQNPSNPAVAEFHKANTERVEFFEYLQWIIDMQLLAVSDHAEEKGLGVGLYMDLALGARVDGAEAWAIQEVLARGVSIGAPPDFYNYEGQNWQIGAWNPHGLQDVYFEPFIKVLRESMRYAGALRIDHVMAFMRLYWIPEGYPSNEGVYVHYPLQDLVGIVALESHRNKCVVVGEDMGTVPAEIRRTMDERALLSYRVHLFTKSGNDYLHSEAYPRNALVVASVHDSPTLKGFWHSKDIHLKKQIGLLSSDAAGREFNTRAKEREGLVHALRREGIDVPAADVHGEFSYELNMGMHRFLARTPCMFQLVQLEDLAEQEEQVNVPGTYEEYPNWRRKVRVSLEDIAERPVVQYISAAVREEGRK